MKPITPDEAAKRPTTVIPDGVIDEFNKIIAEKFRGGEAIVIQKDIADRVAARMETTVGEVYKNRWLDVEDAFREAGWRVEYDRPGYCESYDAKFTFSRKR